MLRGFLLIVFLVLFTNSQAYCERNIYTWKDADGTLNITDKEPPDGVEIIYIRPALKKTTDSSATQIQPQLQKENQQKNITPITEPENQLKKSAPQSGEEIALRQQAEKLISEANELKTRSGGTLKVKRNNKRRARAMEAEAAKLLEKADALANKN